METKAVIGLPTLSRKKQRSAAASTAVNASTQQSREAHQQSDASTPGDSISEHSHALHGAPLLLGRDACLPSTNHSGSGSATQQLLQAQRDRLRATPLGQKVQFVSD